MKKAEKLFLRAFFAIALIASAGFLGCRASAANNPLNVNAANIAVKSDGVTAEISKVENNEVTNNIKFNKLGDSVSFRLTIENTSDEKLTIESIVDDNANELIVYSYDDYAGTEVAASESFDFILKATYETAAANISARKQSFDVAFSFAYKTETGENGKQSIIITPDTPNTLDDIILYVAIFAGAIIGLMLTIILIKKANKKTKIAVAALVVVATAALALPLATKADDDLSAITFKNNYSLMDRIVVTLSDGDESLDIELENGDKLEFDEVLERSGYIFGGWADEEGNPFDLDTPITDDISIHPIWTPIHYMISFDGNGADGGDVMADVEVTYGEEIKLPINTYTLTGHRFRGWNLGAIHLGDGDNALNLTEADGDTAVLMAEWEPIQYTVSIDTDGDGAADITGEIVYGDEFLLYGNDLDNNPGYNPNGWKDGDGNHYDDGADIGSLIVNDGATVTIMPDWEPIHYTIVIDTDNNPSTPGEEIPAVYGGDVNLPNNTADNNPGYKPNGWIDDEGNHYNDGQAVSNLTTTDGDIVNLVPDWAPIHYTVSIDTDGDSSTPSKNIELAYGENYTLPSNNAVSSTPGYSPNGWTDGTNHYGDNEIISNLTTSDGDTINLVPDWSQDRYAITIDAGAGTLVSDPIEGVYGDITNLPIPAAPDGKKFTGWYTGATDGEKVDNPYTITSETTLYAHYRELASEATFGSGSFVGQSIRNINENVTTFRKYATDPQPDDDYSDYSVVSDTNSPAKIYLWQDASDANTVNWWTEAPVAYVNTNYGNNMFYNLGKLKNIDLTGIDVSRAKNLSKFFGSTAITEIDLSGWDTSNVTSISGLFAECGTLTSVTFGQNFDTSKVTNMSQLFDGAKKLQSIDVSMFNTEKVNSMAMMFRGVAATELDLSNFSTPALTNIRLMFAGADKLQTIYVGDGWNTSKVQGTDGNDPYSNDYSIFTNNFALVGGAGTTYGASNPKHKPYARVDDPANNQPGYFTLKGSYRISFNANGGTGSMLDTYIAANSAMSLPLNNYSRSNYTFLGWSLKRNDAMPTYADGQSITLSGDNHNVTLYAIWGEGKWHKITYGGDITEEEVVALGNPFVFKENNTTSGWIYLNNPSRVGYRFRGWSGGLCTTTCINAPIYGDHDLIYNADFTPIPYVIIFDKNGDNVRGNMPNQQFLYDQAEALNANTYTRDGYVFKGWARSVGGPVVYTDEQTILNLTQTSGANIRLYAVWDAI